MNCENTDIKRRCILCASCNYRVLETGRLVYKLVKCSGCGLVYITPIPSDKLLREKYDANYCNLLRKHTARSLKIWQERLKKVEAFCGKGRLLDIGCGDGTFLSLAKKSGWEVSGVETSAASCEYIKKSLGVEVYNGQLKNASYPDEYFDVVTFWHSLEHMTDPQANLRSAQRILKKGGLLAVAMPNFDNYIYKVLYCIGKIRKKPHFLFEDNEKEKEWHLNFFSPRTIKEMLTKTGFSVFFLTTDPSGLTLLKRLIDKIACSILFPIRIKIVLCMQVYARKNNKAAESENASHNERNSS